MQYPRKIQIGFQEGTCPLKCKKCQAFGENAKQEKKVRKMPLDNAKKIIDEISTMETVPAVQPSIYTEPFANNDLWEIMSYCISKGVPLNIITNGILLNKEGMDWLIKYLDRTSVISFSLDAVTQETYERVRGEYSLVELENKVEYLLHNRGDKGPRITVNYVYEEDNYHEKDLFLEKWKNKADAVRICAVLDSNRKVPEIYRKKDVIRKERVCSFLQETMAIDTGGEVRACSSDAFGETYLGNVFEEGIISIWRGKNMKMLRDKHIQKSISSDEICYGCEWGCIYDFNHIEETEDFVCKIADYAIYYNRK